MKTNQDTGTNSLATDCNTDSLSLDILIQVKEDIINYLNSFNSKRLNSISSLTLSKIQEKTNPFLAAAKGLSDEEVIRDKAHAFLESSIETIHGNLIEDLVKNIANKLYGATKSHYEGIDLEYKRGDCMIFMQVKSGEKWGNSSSRAKFSDYIDQINYTGKYEVINFCTYGKADKNKGNHRMLASVKAWEYLTDDTLFMSKLVEEIRILAKVSGIDFETIKNVKIEQLVDQFKAEQILRGTS